MPINNIPTLIVNINNSIYSLFKLFCNEIIPYLNLLRLKILNKIMLSIIIIITKFIISLLEYRNTFLIINIIIKAKKYIK